MSNVDFRTTNNKGRGRGRDNQLRRNACMLATAPPSTRLPNAGKNGEKRLGDWRTLPLVVFSVVSTADCNPS